MNRIQTHRIQSTFKLFEPCGEAFIALVLLRLADKHPHVRRLFPQDTAKLHSVFFATLKQIVRNIDRFSSLEGPLMKLGTDAQAVGATAIAYSTIKVELLATMRELAAEAWTEQSEADWRTALDAVVGAMLRGSVVLPRAAA